MEVLIFALWPCFWAAGDVELFKLRLSLCQSKDHLSGQSYGSERKRCRSRTSGHHTRDGTWKTEIQGSGTLQIIRYVLLRMGLGIVTTTIMFWSDRLQPLNMLASS